MKQLTERRWLGQLTAEQAAALRRHLQEVVRRHGRFGEELWAGRTLVVDLDGQGLVARGRRFEHAHGGYLGEGIDRGYQRYVCYAGATGEVLDEVLLPGNQTAMSALPKMRRGLNECSPSASGAKSSCVGTPTSGRWPTCVRCVRPANATWPDRPWRPI